VISSARVVLGCALTCRSDPANAELSGPRWIPLLLIFSAPARIGHTSPRKARSPRTLAIMPHDEPPWRRRRRCADASIDLIVSGVLRRPITPFRRTAVAVQMRSGTIMAPRSTFRRLCSGFIFSLATRIIFLRHSRSLSVACDRRPRRFPRIPGWTPRHLRLFGDGAGCESCSTRSAFSASSPTAAC